MQFPEQFESAVEDTEIVVQKTLTKEYLRQAMEIKSETRIMVSNIQKSINIEKQRAKGQAELLKRQAQAEAYVLRLDKQR